MRIASTKNIQKITSSMKMVSAAKLNGDQRRLTAAKHFASWTKDIGAAAMPCEQLTSASIAAFPESSVVVAITSDKGLCGGVHSTVARNIRSLVAMQTAAGKETEIIVVGEKGRSQLRRMVGPNLKTAMTDCQLPYGFELASIAAQYAMAAEKGTVQVVYNTFVSAIAYSPTIKTVAPFTEDSFVESADPDTKDELLADLYEYYLSTEIFYGMMQGQTSEQSSRMSAMENATKNAGELIDKLTLVYNRARQARITTELIEIISGASALEDQK